ncbi:MAG: hypothetical protein GX128_07375 [Bacteroidales bacterium]|jgi:polysaccharide export outer membrane protein|nr:hypothetical protein [Bacteroidales bacterium]
MKLSDTVLKFKARPVLLPLVLVLIFSSCISQKKLKYMVDDFPKSVYEHYPRQDYKIQPGDNLFIQVLGLDAQTADLFSFQPSGAYRQYQTNDLSAYLSSYTVDPKGYVEFSIIGNIFVKDKTINEIKILLQEAISEYMRDATVIVKLVNFRVTLLGEVARPGQYPVYHTQINIFEALAMAGDLTQWGDRRNVHLIRSTKGESQVIKLDISGRKILESEYYFLMPDDILYVIPMEAKTFAFTTFPYSVVFSTITTALLILNFFK